MKTELIPDLKDMDIENTDEEKGKKDKKHS